jgi:NAD(P)-dependent dehydrogenase (short-subunit alcohol dehydrogenase family)
MPNPFITGGVAVITGAASGIGRAAARRAASSGMKLALVDVNQTKLDATATELRQVAGVDNVLAETVDVSSFEQMQELARTVSGRFGSPTLLMNNAAAFVAGGAGGILDPNENWQRLFAVNVLGVVNGVQAFLPGMLASQRRSFVVNTGSKQGLTNPPGNPAYNTSKAAVNAYTQNLARDVRDRAGSAVTAHLLVPGWTTTGDAAPNPSAWLPEQVVDFMADAIGRDEFYIICPDGETTAEIDRKRIYWNALDIILGRPALSRWHKDYKQKFADFMARSLTIDEV